MEPFWPYLAAAFGLVVGSFLNVVINRLKQKKTLGGRSECPHCRHELSAKDLFPVLSFVFLRARCRYCGKRISWQYPVVELGTAATFLLVALRMAPGPEAFFILVLACFFIVIAVYDCKHMLILDKVVFPGLAVAVTYALFRDFSGGCQAWMSLSCATVSGLAGIVAISGFFLLQYWFSRNFASVDWIGFGDVKLGLLLGMAVGFPLAIFLLFTGYTLGAIVGVYLLATSKAGMQSQLPFGTFLALSAIITLLYGQGLMGAYLQLIGF